MTTPNIEELIARNDGQRRNANAKPDVFLYADNITALRSQAERIKVIECTSEMRRIELHDVMLESDQLRAQLEAIAATEPVAWRGRCTDPLHDWCLFYRRQESQEKFLNMEWQPLFTRPMPARPQDHEIRAQEPVLVVEKEPDYWSGGHFHEGSKPHIKPTKVWCLPIGTKLFTRPMPTQGVNAELVEALEKLARLGNGEHYGNSDGNMIARDALSKYKGAK